MLASAAWSSAVAKHDESPFLNGCTLWLTLFVFAWLEGQRPVAVRVPL